MTTEPSSERQEQRQDSYQSSPGQSLAVTTLSYVSGETGLSRLQRQWLLAWPRYQDDDECSRAVGIDEATPRQWRHRSALFVAQYDATVQASLAVMADRTMEELHRMAGMLPSTIERLLSAEDDVYDKSGRHLGRAVNWRAVRDGGELLMRGLEIWQPRQQIGAQDNESAAQLRRIADTLEAARQQSSRPTASVQDSGQDASIVEGTAEVLPDGPGP